MVKKIRTVLLNAYVRWPSFIQMELWTFAFHHVVNQWNNTPRLDLAYKTPDERFNELKQQINEKNHFKSFHPFGCLVYVLNDKMHVNPICIAPRIGHPYFLCRLNNVPPIVCWIKSRKQNVAA